MDSSAVKPAVFVLISSTDVFANPILKLFCYSHSARSVMRLWVLSLKSIEVESLFLRNLALKALNYISGTGRIMSLCARLPVDNSISGLSFEVDNEH